MTWTDAWAALFPVLAAAGKVGNYGDDGVIGLTPGDHGSLIAWKVSVISGPYKMRLILWKDGTAQGPEMFVADDGGVRRGDEIISHLDALLKMGAPVQVETLEQIARYMFDAGIAYEAGMQAGGGHADDAPVAAFQELAFRMALTRAREKVYGETDTGTGGSPGG